MTAVQPDRDEDRSAQTFIDWFQINTRWISIAAGVVVVAAAGYWFYTRSNEIKAERSSRDLMAARQSVASGNAQLAQSDLQKIVDKYSGTEAATEAGLLMAEISYGKGEYAKGIDVLNKLSGRGADLAASRIQSMIGDGQLQLGKIDDAIGSYQKAADVASTDGERAIATAKKARAQMAGNKLADAKKTWSDLANAAWAGTMQGEARVRLGELEAATGGKS